MQAKSLHIVCEINNKVCKSALFTVSYDLFVETFGKTYYSITKLSLNLGSQRQSKTNYSSQMTTDETKG